MNKSILKGIGDRLQLIRKEKKISQIDIGNRFSVARHTILNYENGHRAPNVDYLLYFINEFNVNANWLLTGEGEMFKDASQGHQTKIEKIKAAFPGIEIDDTFMTVINALADPDLTEVLRHEFWIAMKAAGNRFPQLFQKSNKEGIKFEDKQTVMVGGGK